MFFSRDDKSVVKSVGFLEEFGTLYDLMIYLRDNSMRMITSSEDQLNFFEAMTVLKKNISDMKTDVTDKSEEQKKKIFA